MEQGTGLLIIIIIIIIMRINQTNDFRLMFRKKERYICLKWTKYTGNCRSRFFKKAGPKTFPVYKKNPFTPIGSENRKRISDSDLVQSPISNPIPGSHGTRLSKDISAALCRSFRLPCLTIPPSRTLFCSLPSYESVYYQALSNSWIVNKTLAVKSRYFILHATTICNLR